VERQNKINVNTGKDHHKEREKGTIPTEVSTEESVFVVASTRWKGFLQLRLVYWGWKE
jgi:hypothetical protein